MSVPAKFCIQAADPADVEVLQRTLGLPRFVAAVLVARGIGSPQQARDFLEPSLARDWRNPYEIPGMAETVDGVESAIRSGRRILVFGDFDLDGMSATAVLTRGLRALGAEVVPFIPRRSDEGYGLSCAAIERFMQHKPDVVITVDCGISCRDEVVTLQHRGVEVFVTDHHEPGDLVPQDVPVCDPKMEEGNPQSVLAGVGVALKLVQCLGARFGQPHLWRTFTDLATLGTVADLVPLTGDNRALVADGIAAINGQPRPCIAALLACARADDKPVTSSSLSFSAIPRLNAAGRMGDAGMALDLLLEDDLAAAQEKAAALEAVNDQRRAIEAELAEIASLQAAEAYHGQRVLVVSGDGWHEGVKGIVASRLVRTYGVPVILFSVDAETGLARGSGRSVGQVNLFKAVEACAELLTRFGGHEAAVGVTLPADELPEFTRRLERYMDGLPADSFHPRMDIDAEVDLSELTIDAVERLDALAPFGQENRRPRFLARGVVMTRSRAVGVDKNHLSTVLSDGRSEVAGIMFHSKAIDALLRCESVVDASFELQIDEWRGRRTVKAMIDHIAPAEPCCALLDLIEPESRSFMAGLYDRGDELCRADDEDEACDEELAGVFSQRARNRAEWEARAEADPAGLQAAIVRAFIGDRELFESQRAVLESLAAGSSTLAVMATGRGKSLTFQVNAAVRALSRHEASVFVYPLRALIADQAFHLQRALEPFGVEVAVVTGESTPDERRSVFEGLADGTVDIVLTTPEFLGFHAREFAQSGRVAFCVVDEAHHIGLAHAGNRESYAQVGESIRALGSPEVLALTATADCRVAGEIEGVLHTSARVLDRTDRPNLHVDDQRNLRAREPYLANLLAAGQKTVVYVNSRQQSVALARTLRNLVPQMAPFIGFYNAGLPRADRAHVEELFRAGTLNVLVSTSAFGEGVNIPDIRHVVLYHLPFNEIEFNQMSGRAGRDGRDAWIHLLFGAEDAGINEHILHETTPDHDTMAQVYRELRAWARAGGGKPFDVSFADLAAACGKRVPVHAVSAASVACGIAVFRELGLIETLSPDLADRPQAVRVLPTEAKVELTDSVRYREGLDEYNAFTAFRDWALGAPVRELELRLTRPILPEDDAEGGVRHG